MVKNVWERPVYANNPIIRWNKKMRAIHKHLSGWASHTTCILKKKKLRLSSIIDEIDALTEVRPLTSIELDLKNQSNTQLAGLLFGKKS
jgi:hypothetical protein